MEITKTVPVTIEIGEVGCSEHCQFFEDLGDGELGCRRYGDISERRHPACLAEFGTSPNTKREYVLDDDQLWAAILGMQAAIRECNDEWQGMEDPQPSQDDENWFAARLRDLIKLREGR